MQSYEAADGKLDATQIGIVATGADTASPRDVAEAMDLIPVTFIPGETTRPLSADPPADQPQA